MADIDTLYARWLSGDLSAAEEEALKASGEWEELEAIIQAADQLTLPSFDAEAAYAEFSSNKGAKTAPKLKALPKTAQKSEIRRIGWMRVLAVAASIALLIAALYLFQQPGTTTVSAEWASNEQHQLLDNSTVVLNDGSRISYDEANWATERRIQLEGEALFDVEKGNPFLVETRYGLVEVLGTSFNVRAWERDLYVECYSGKVKVRTANGAEILTKGQAVNVLEGKLEEVKAIQHTAPLWRKGISRFYDESLNSVFEELSRQYNIEVKTPPMNRNFSGSFQHDNLENALRAICKPMGLTYEMGGDGKSVVISKADN